MRSVTTGSLLLGSSLFADDLRLRRIDDEHRAISEDLRCARIAASS
jgi:hypothetical protein